MPASGFAAVGRRGLLLQLEQPLLGDRREPVAGRRDAGEVGELGREGAGALGRRRRRARRDSAHTAWNRCWAAGIPSSVSTAPPPADCPAIVTRDGSPPNAAMFSRTHSSAASQSRTPRLDGAPAMWPKPSKPSRYETMTVTTPSRLNARPSYQGLAGEPAVYPPPWM